ncbi:MarR family winged helix-turn-helix transcriptional regulator [Chitinophaga vietnamensis]|uniref:MarR family winged helix-turn-helix transcriptional regulator n=1 Tax=Chitinophaga vietnamensis TaxID=2593957 RepID=UPI0011776CB5|nr:MarR family transcriptional regulator [Chitinophaga vietnamensis]
MSNSIDARYEACMAKRPHSLARLINLLKKDMDNQITEKLQERGYRDFKLGDMVLLINIDAHGTINNDLARKARISKQAMSKVVKNLEADGYINSRKHDTDNRASVIFLTEKGKKLVINAAESVEEVEHSYTDILGDKDMAQLKSLLIKLNKGLGL